MKKVICSVMLGMFIAGVTVPVQVEASWFSKTWKKIENSLDTESTTAPPSVNRKLHDVGHLMDKSELKVAGVPIGYHQYADYLCPVHQLLQEYIPLHQFLQNLRGNDLPDSCIRSCLL